MLFGICLCTSHMSKLWYTCVIAYSNLSNPELSSFSHWVIFFCLSCLKMLLKAALSNKVFLDQHLQSVFWLFSFGKFTNHFWKVKLNPVRRYRSFLNASRRRFLEILISLLAFEIFTLIWSLKLGVWSTGTVLKKKEVWLI